MSSFYTYLCLGALVLGIVLLVISQNLHPGDGENSAVENWLNKMSYQPPGYYPAMTGMLSIALMILGFLGMFFSLFLEW
jgi:hypothetical protein